MLDLWWFYCAFCSDDAHCFLFSLHVLGGVITVSMGVDMMFQDPNDSMVVEWTGTRMNYNRNAIAF